MHRLANQDDRDLNPGILSADGKQVVTVDMGRQKGRLRLWDVASGQLLRELGDHGCIAGCFSPDQKILATFGTSQPGVLQVRIGRHCRRRTIGDEVRLLVCGAGGGDELGKGENDENDGARAGTNATTHDVPSFLRNGG